MIVPTPCASATVALTGAREVDVKVSLTSSSRSPLTVTVTVFVVVARREGQRPARRRVVRRARPRSPFAVA